MAIEYTLDQRLYRLNMTKKALHKQCVNRGKRISYEKVCQSVNFPMETESKYIALLREGDKLIVTKLDRFARSAVQGSQMIENLIAKGVIVHVLNIGIMDNTPTGKLIRNIMLSFAEFERDMIVERTQEGKAIAREKGIRVDGRPSVKIDHEDLKKFREKQKKRQNDRCRMLCRFEHFSFYMV